MNGLKPVNDSLSIAAAFDDVVGTIVPKSQRPAPKDGNNFKHLVDILPGEAAPQVQLRLDLGIQVERQIDGIEMEADIRRSNHRH